MPYLFIINFLLVYVYSKCHQQGDWPEVDEGEVVKLPCPKYYSGNYIRTCYKYSLDYGFWGAITPCVVDPIQTARIIHPHVIVHPNHKPEFYTLDIRGAELKYELVSNNSLPEGITFNSTTGLLDGESIDIFNETRYSLLVWNKPYYPNFTLPFTIKSTLNYCKNDKVWSKTEGDTVSYLPCRLESNEDDDDLANEEDLLRNGDITGIMTRYCAYNSDGINTTWKEEDKSFCQVKQANPPKESAYLYFVHKYNNLIFDNFTLEAEYHLLLSFIEFLNISKSEIMMYEKSSSTASNIPSLLINLQFTLNENNIDYYKQLLPNIIQDEIFIDTLISKDEYFQNITSMETMKIEVVYHQEKNILLIIIVVIVILLLIFATLLWYFITQYRIKNLLHTNDSFEASFDLSNEPI